MKILILTLAMVLPLLARAEETNVLAGQYTDCAVEYAEPSSTPKSNRYVFTFGDNASLELVKESYEGTEQCDNQPITRTEYKHFTVLEDSGEGPGRWITAQEMDTKLFFKFVIAKSYAVIDASTTDPEKTGLVEAIILDRVP